MSYQVGLANLFATAARVVPSVSAKVYRVVHVAAGWDGRAAEYKSAPKTLADAITKRDEMRGNYPGLKVWVEDELGSLYHEHE